MEAGLSNDDEHYGILVEDMKKRILKWWDDMDVMELVNISNIQC